MSESAEERYMDETDGASRITSFQSSYLHHQHGATVPPRPSAAIADAVHYALPGSRRRRRGSRPTSRAAMSTPTVAQRRRENTYLAGQASLRSSSALLLRIALLSLTPSCSLCSSPLVSVPATTAAATVAPSPVPKPANLWDAISGDPLYSKLTACLEMADPSVADLLRGASGASTGQPLTLFAPRDSAFEQPAWRGGGRNATIFEDRCKDEQSATELVSYHVSWTTSATPYIGEEFPTLLGIQFSPRYYGITKSPDVLADYFPIQFVDSANITAKPLVIGGPDTPPPPRAGGGGDEGPVSTEGGSPSYLYPVDRVLRVPVGTIWETLSSDPSFSLLVTALNATGLWATLDSKGGTGAYTLFAPDNEAIRASPDFPEDPAALQVLLSFHIVAAGVYPLSLSGEHFSQQLFKVDPSAGSLSRDFYREFYTGFFEDGQVTSLAGPLLNVSTVASPPASCLASTHNHHNHNHHHRQQQQQQQQQQRKQQQQQQSPPPPPPLPPPPPPPPPPPEQQQQQQPRHWDEWLVEQLPPPPLLPRPLHEAHQLLIDGVPISEHDITATNGVVHRLSARVMSPPDTVAGVLLDPPFPLSAAGASAGGGSAMNGSGFEALGELVRLAWPLVNATLKEEGPLTFLAPTDAAFDLAIAAGHLPPRPWYNESSPFSSSHFSSASSRILSSDDRSLLSPSPPGPSSTASPSPPFSSSPSLYSPSSSSSAPTSSTSPSNSSSPGTAAAAAAPPSPPSPSYPSALTPKMAARVLLSHALWSPEGHGPVLFSPTATDPFASGFRDGDRFPTAAAATPAAIGRGVEVGVRILEVGTRSAVAGKADGVADREVYVDGARVTQCIDGTGFGHDCGLNPRPSNTYALNGPHLCAVHAVDRVIFPAEPEMNLEAILDGMPNLSRFSALLRENGLFPLPAPSIFSSATSSQTSSRGNRGPTATAGGDFDEVENSGGGGRDLNSERGNIPTESRAFTTIFAPTNAALNRLEKQRPWLFRNSTLPAPEAVGSSVGVGDGGSGKGVVDEGTSGRDPGMGGDEDWSPVRELLAYHLVPGATLFSRYFNESSPPTRTLALNETAPLAISFVHTRLDSGGVGATSDARFDSGKSVGVGVGVGTRGSGAGAGAGTLRVNLGSCSSTDRSASDGVLHVLAFVADEDDDNGLVDGGYRNSNNGGRGDDVVADFYDGDGVRGGGGGESDDDFWNGGGKSGGSGALSAGAAADAAADAAVAAGAVAAAGVVVPDVLELTYAYGFRETYAAIVTAASSSSAGGADADADDSGEYNFAAKRTSVAKALRGRAAHTLLAVADGRDGESRPYPRRDGSVLGESRGRAAGDALRYQTLLGDQTFGPAPATDGASSSRSALAFPSVGGAVAFKTLLAGAYVHLFNNSENLVNPFFSSESAAAARTNTSRTGLNLNQAEVLSVEGSTVMGMVALNGRIHQISGSLAAPAPDVYSVLSSHPQLSGWADWVELTGLAELLSDPKAGPFTVFAPVDSSLELVPGLATVAAGKSSLAKLVRFHVAMGTLTAATAAAAAAAGAPTGGGKGSRLFTPSLANATAEQRSALSGERFASGPRLWTLLDSEHEGDGHGGKAAMTITVQIAAAAAGSIGGGTGGGIRVFLGPGGGRRQRVAGADLFLGAFAAEVVLPDLNAVNGVVHGISGVMTYPGFKKPKPRYSERSPSAEASAAG